LRFFCNYPIVTAGSDPDRPSVLLDFRAANVRSFRDSISFTMRAGAMSDPDVVRHVAWNQTEQTVDVLPAAAVFGANGSGKTNLLRALHDLRSHVLHSFRSAASPTGGVARRPFLLDGERRSEPSSFEIELVLRGVRHEYAFTVDDERYLTERAHHFPRGRRSLLFEREGLDVTFGAEVKARGRAVADILRPNALFLSTAAFAGHPALSELYGWFARNLILADAKTRAHRQGYTTNMIFNEERRESVLALLRLVDSGIVDVIRRQMDPVVHERIRRAVRIVMGEEGEPDTLEDTPPPDLGVGLAHRGTAGEQIEFDSEDESLGTLVWFGVVGPVIDALADGCVFLADEIDASLHPDLSRQLVRIFQSHETNPRRAQLIFNSHDTTLLGDTGQQLVGRDQVWFVDKEPDGASVLRHLVEFSPRKDAALGRRYLAGHFGAKPTTSDETVDRAVLEAIARRHG
jgi:uncharacterized protein